MPIIVINGDVNRLLEGIVRERLDGVAVRGHLDDFLGAPVDNDQPMSGDGDAGAAAPQQAVVRDVLEECEVGGAQHLDAAVARVHDVHAVAGLVDGDGHRLQELVLAAAPAAVYTHGVVVLSHVEEQRAVFDGTFENGYFYNVTTRYWWSVVLFKKIMIKKL